MTRTARLLTVAGSLVAAVGLALLGTAWACTGQPQVFSVSPLTAAAGSEVEMRGDAVAPGTPVAVRWNGVSGPKLAEVTADRRGEFALSFAVPADAEPGVHSLMVVAGEGEADAGVGRTTLQVAADPQAGSPTQADSGFAAEEVTSLQAAEQAGTSPALAAGVVLFTVGVVGLFGGFALATTQRRRASASAGWAQR